MPTSSIDPAPISFNLDVLPPILSLLLLFSYCYHYYNYYYTFTVPSVFVLLVDIHVCVYIKKAVLYHFVMHGYAEVLPLRKGRGQHASQVPQGRDVQFGGNYSEP